MPGLRRWFYFLFLGALVERMIENMKLVKLPRSADNQVRKMYLYSAVSEHQELVKLHITLSHSTLLHWTPTPIHSTAPHSTPLLTSLISILLQSRPRHDATRRDTTRHDTTRHDTTRHDTTRHCTALCCAVLYYSGISNLMVMIIMVC